jgi:hypothetical protein
VVVATAVLVARALVAERQTIDDVFIFLRYARTIAEHGAYAFGEAQRAAPVEGTSSVAWTLALAGAWRMGLRGVGAAKGLSLLAGALVPVTCAFAVKRALPRDRVWIAAVAPLALAFDADLASAATSGMDTALWALACAVCVALAAAGRLRAASAALGALAWVRPEGPLFTVLGVAALARDRRAALRLAAIAAVPLAVLTLARLAYFHDVVPNTFWAKMNGAADATDYTGLGYVAGALGRRPLLLLALPLVAVRPARLDTPAARTARIAFALLLASLFFAFVAGGDWMPNRRLVVEALPLGAVLSAVSVSRLPGPTWALATCAALVGEAALTFDHAVDQRWRDVEWLDERVARWNDPGRARPFVEPYRLDWMPAHLLEQIAPYVSPGDSVAHVDVGELPYVMQDVAFLDGFGLVDRIAGRLAFSPGAPTLRASARAAFFDARPAAAIVVVNEATGRPFSPAQDAVLEDPRFTAGWRELARVPTWGGHPCVTFVRRDVAPVPDEIARARVRAWLDRVPDVTVAP